ncbi:hypothetical protein AB0M11_12780 [Streptomyces sp. NPDC051987]|uniref:hypothetical protein n=1 Tax=Streptomyces sp. NPDC051987 TaxID=3155808 RepID=UPI0034488F44
MAVAHHARTGPPGTQARPKPPSATVPERPPAAVPEPLSATVPERSSATVPEPPSATVPERPPATVPEPLSATVPERSSATVPEPPSATVPERPAAAVRAQPSTVLPAEPPARDPRRTLLALAALTAAVLLLLAGAHRMRPAPYGDHLTPGPAAPTARARGDVVEAYDGRTLRWRYARVGRRPLSVLPARGQAITVWDDGLVTDTDGRSVHWHRALPAATGWLRARGGAGVLRPLGRGILAVVTPARIAGYRTTDGDLRWVLPARAGCAFRPERAVRHGHALLVAQPCAHGAWTAQLVAVDDLGGIAPHRAPLGNQPTGTDRPGHPRTEKALAPPR